MSEPLEPTIPAPHPSGFSGRHVLVVEDHAIGRILLEAMLAGLGVTARLTGTAAEALAAMAEERFDAALVDLGLPDARGEDLARRLARMAPAGMPIVAVTGRERPTAIPPVFAAWLEKPFSARDLHRLLADLGEIGVRSA